MSQLPRLPANPLNRFQDLYEALNADRGWFGDASSLRFAAMTATTCQGSPVEVASSIRSMAEEIKRLSGWFGELNSSLRFIVSAILVLNGDRASDFLAEVEQGRNLFRQAGLRRGGIYETIAILILRLQNDLAPVTAEAVLRFKAIYENLEAITDAKALMDMQSIINAQQAAAAAAASSAAIAASASSGSG